MLQALSIRHRLLAAFGLMLVLVMVVAAMGGLGVRSAQGDLLRLSEQLQPLRAHADLAQRWLLQARVAEQAMVASNLDNAAMAGHKKAWDAALDRSLAELQQLRARLSTPDQATGVDAIVSQLGAYRAAYERFYKDLADARFPDTREATAAMGDVNTAVAAAQAGLARQQQVVDEISQDLETGADRLAQRVSVLLVAGVAVALALGVGVARAVSRSILLPLEQAQRLALHIAAGDLTNELVVQGQDEAARTLQSLQQMTASLRRTVSQVRAAADSMQTASREVALGNLDLSQRTEQTASSLQQAASAIGQLSGTLQHSAESARSANQLAGSAAEVAARGGEVVSQVVATMQDIHTASQKISDIIGVIDGIAFQTNILALNAAVEAARAGEQGRGFAVVASEVRSLAGRSAEAAREIKRLIGNSVERVDAGARLVHEAGQTMQEIVTSVRRVSGIVGDMAADVSAQSGSIGQVNHTVGELDRMTQQNAALVEESAAAAESLKDQAGKLATAVASFKV